MGVCVWGGSGRVRSMWGHSSRAQLKEEEMGWARWGQPLSGLSVPPRISWTVTAPRAVAQDSPSWCKGQWHDKWPLWSV